MSGAQTRRASLLEAIANTVVGYFLAVLTQIAVFPIFGIKAGMSDHLGIGAAFVVVSLLRSYALRRAFEWLRGQKE